MPTASSGVSIGSAFYDGAFSSRRLLGAEIGCPASEIRFDIGPHGKPSVGWPTTDLHFSTASTYGLALIAIARVPVGVDCEQVRADRSDQQPPMIIDLRAMGFAIEDGSDAPVRPARFPMLACMAWPPSIRPRAAAKTAPEPAG